ncbi:putative ATP-dependent DNA helicase Q1 isoform X1 [Atheta coriaria]|uniref:putative ATP-dependent DNA helicase Q1 isoform X1 n=1 Tax=Dalotia coriaria TaxID=877792 RepID=UPI0031F40CC0
MDEEDIPLKIGLIESEIYELTRKREELTRRINRLKSQKDELQANYNLKKSLEVDETLTNVDYAWSKNAQKVLEEKFNLKSFRTQQLAAINATLSKKDLLLLMPTGGGKTLCYQLPAVIDKGMTLVVSPLIALMQDQLINLRKLGINAMSMSSTTDKDAKKAGFQYMSKGIGPDLKLMYVTPEWLAKSKTFMSSLQKLHERGKLDRIAIDEVHCCSQWGHDFRPDYKYLGLLKGMFKDVPIIGLTATATTSVLLDIQNMLDIPGCTILRAPFDRHNLNFKVVSKPDKSDDCYDYLEKLLTKTFKDQSGIIYTATIKDSSEIMKGLRARNIKALSYHADLEEEVKTLTHTKWLESKIQVVVATVAFGMGIDKPDVRFVIHYSIPKSMETLYQESGRAGRDGKDAQCIVMFKLSDYMKNSGYARSKVEVKNAFSVLEYCLSLKHCRHYLIGLHFEEMEIRRCNSMCDNCKKATKENNHLQDYDVADANVDIHKLITTSMQGDKNLTVAKLVDVWLKPTVKIRKPGISKQQAEDIIGHLLIKKCLTEEKNYTPYSVNCYLRCGMTPESVVISMVSDKSLDKYLKIVSTDKKRQLDGSDDDCVVVIAGEKPCTSNNKKTKR